MGIPALRSKYYWFPTKKPAGKFTWALSALFFCILSVLTQSGDCRRITEGWDFVVPHERRVTFYSISTKERQDFEVPVPTVVAESSIRGAEVGLGNNNNTSDTTTTNTTTSTASIFSSAQGQANNSGSQKSSSADPLLNFWEQSRILKLALDPERQLLFLASSNPTSKNLIFLSVYNITSEKSFGLLGRNSAGISDLLFWNNSLFWSETGSDTIWRLNVSSNDIRDWSREAVESFYRVPDQAQIMALTVHHKSGTFFWVNGKEDRIEYYNGKKTGEVIVDIKRSLHVLTTDSDHLYWVRSLGASSYVDKVRIDDLSKREDAFHMSRHKDIHSLGILCTGDLVLTDTDYAKVWYRRRDAMGERVELDFPGRQMAISLVSKSFATQDWHYCRSNISSVAKTTISTVVAPKPIEIPQGTVGSSNGGAVRTSTSKSSGSDSATVKSTSTISPAADVTERNGSHETIINTSAAAAATTTTTTTEVVRPVGPNLPQSTAAGAALSPVPTATTVPSGAPLESMVVSEVTPPVRTSSHWVTEDPSTVDNSSVVSWCPQGHGNPCKAGELCVMASRKFFCLSLPQLGDLVSGKLESRGGDSDSAQSVHFPGYMSATLFIIICSTLSLLVVILTATVIFMYVRLRRVDKKPRIRRRVIVSHNRERQGRDRGSSVCELIDIENCCNMNECETACYEREVPGTASASTRPTGATPRKEDKQKLIEI